MPHTDGLSGSLSRRNHLVWAGALISVVGLISYFLVFARFAPVRDVPWVNLPMVVVGVAVSAWALRRRRGVWAIAGLAVSALAALALVAYVFVISSSLPSTEGVLAVGAPAPAFALPDHSGATVRLDDALASGSRLVLVFYRGFW